MSGGTLHHEIRWNVGPPGMSRGVGQLSEDGSQGLIPVAGAAIVLLACTGIVPKGHPGLGRQARRRAKTGHLDARCGHPPLHPLPVDLGDRVQQTHRPDTRARHLWVPWSHLALRGVRPPWPEARRHPTPSGSGSSPCVRLRSVRPEHR
jgi:hypothetical protein